MKIKFLKPSIHIELPFAVDHDPKIRKVELLGALSRVVPNLLSYRNIEEAREYLRTIDFNKGIRFVDFKNHILWSEETAKTAKQLWDQGRKDPAIFDLSDDDPTRFSSLGHPFTSRKVEQLIKWFNEWCDREIVKEQFIVN